MAHTQGTPVVAVVGHGMVGHRLLERLVATGVADTHHVVVLGDEPHPAYDRVGLSGWFEGKAAEELHLPTTGFGDHPGIELRLGVGVTGLDVGARTLTLADGGSLAWDELVLATGARPVRPPVPGIDLPGVLVYRTLDDLTAISDAAQGRSHAVVVGGGLLGLEAANALRLLGLDTTVVELAPWLLSAQVDEGGGVTVIGHVEHLGVTALAGTGVAALVPGADGAVAGVETSDGTVLPADVVVVATGVRPDDALAAAAGIETAERGGIVIDASCRTSAPHVWAIGDVAAFGGRAVGLVAPGYAMAEVVAEQLAGHDATYAGADTSTALKMMGVDVASVGDAHGTTPGAVGLVWADPTKGVYKKLVVSDDGKRVLGAVLVGDTEPYALVRALVESGEELTTDPGELVAPRSAGAPQLALPDTATVCTCHGVTAGEIRCAVRDGDAAGVPEMKVCTRAGTGCGSCVATMKKLIDTELRAAGRPVVTAVCEHFAHSRPELYSLVRLRGLSTWSSILAELGRGGQGCDICKPLVASLLATLAPRHALDPLNAPLQDTNDHLLANMQKDGTYSIVPRLPGGEVTPDQLSAIADVAREFDLYTKITGGQRIDLFGATVGQLPAIWRRLVEAGLESGHAYGKSLRTVKSCVGDSWCRFGVGDSVSLAVRLELRYRGLRAPHKLKSAVSGCARECAEAQSKDFGVIATDKGWNLYVCGNGGFRPRHAELLAADLDEDTLVRTIDRFLMFYVRTADRLQRTAPWLEAMDGGLEHLRAVVVDDVLGIGAELEADMERHVAGYRDEWADTLDDPAKLRRFVAFVNAPDRSDPNVVHVRERAMKRPARAGEKPRDEVLVSGPTIPVGAR